MTQFWLNYKSPGFNHQQRKTTIRTVSKLQWIPSIDSNLSCRKPTRGRSSSVDLIPSLSLVIEDSTETLTFNAQTLPKNLLSSQSRGYRDIQYSGELVVISIRGAKYSKD